MKFRYAMARNNLIFGENAIESLAEEVKKLGEKVLLVTGKKNMKRLGFVDKATNILKKAGIQVFHYGEVESNPTVGIIDRGAKKAFMNNCDIVVGLGGGSSIDTAKAIAVLVGHFQEKRSIWDFAPVNEEPMKITAKTLPVIAVTSTSGTGSHVNLYSTFTNPITCEKPVIASDFIFPRVSIVDIEIVSNMPPFVTATTGFDALTHALESLVCRQSTPISDLYCLEAIKLISHYLPLVYVEGNNKEGRERMALADTYAGWADNTADAVLPHALSHPITGHYPQVAHGASLAAITPLIMRFNIEKGDRQIVEKYCLAAEKMGKSISSPYNKAKALKSVEAMEELLDKIKLNKSLQELGTEKDKLSVMAEDAFRTMGDCIKANPREVSIEEVVRLYEECY